MAWSVAVLARLRDWRIGVLTAMLGLLSLDLLLTMLAEQELSVISLRFQAMELAGLLVSVLALLAVFFVERVITVHRAAEKQLRIEKMHLEQLFQNAPEAVVVLDNEDRMIRANSEFTRMFGYSLEEAVGRRINDLIVPDHLSEEGISFTNRVARGEKVSAETVRQHKNGELVDVSILGTPIKDESGQVAVYGIYRDITKRKQAEAALRDSEQRYALVARAGNDGLWDWDLKTDEVFFSARWKAMLGAEEHEIRGSPDEWFRRVHPEDADRLKRDIQSHREGSGHHFENEHRIRHKDGTYRWMLCRGMAVFEASGEPCRILGSQTDISARKTAEEQLLHDALHDALTGLPNRLLFMDRLERAIARTKRQEDYTFGTLFLDLDRFKVVNDSLGHLTGDHLLVAISRRLQTCLRPGDTVARFGGDEFAILLDGISDVSDAIRIADRFQKELRQPFGIGGQEAFTTASVGIAVGASDYERPEEVIRDADTAMYRAKARGRGLHEVFDERMHAHAVAVLEMENDLRRAIERTEFRTYYQPIMALKTERIVGFEALLRWKHPVRGVLQPSEFIALAEETGLILPIGKWVLREACKQAHAWQTAHNGGPPLAINVNLSARQFQQPDLLEQVEEAVRESGLPPTCLKLEMTESVLMDHAEAHVAVLHEFNALGVQVHIDDFGTGYSSLSYLQRFPVDALKIDRSFVSQMDGKEENRAIVQTIVTLARNLGMDVIAEGVETPEQLDALRSMECSHGQGFYFSKPLDADAATALVAEAPQKSTKK